jgi:hypothetical protein
MKLLRFSCCACVCLLLFASAAFSQQVAITIDDLPSHGTLRFGPMLAAEHLAEEDGLHIDEETLRRWMLEYGLWMHPRAEACASSPASRWPATGEVLGLNQARNQ